MSFNVEKFLQDQNVDYVTGSSNHKHARPGWINIECPFCTGNPGYHLGYFIKGEYWSCWRCKGKSTTKVVQALMGCSWGEASKTVEIYDGRPVARYEDTERNKDRPWVVSIENKCISRMGTRHRKYLEKRNFDPDELEGMWDLKAFGPVGAYKHRLFIPIYYQGRLVSFQGRDVTGKLDLRYKACPQREEAIEHQTILYGLDEVKGRSIVLVEGVTDVWRMGAGSVASFGIAYTMKQIQLLSHFKRIFIMFDNRIKDPQAGKAADKLAMMLSSLGRDVEIIDIDDDDPGCMSQRVADEIMTELLGPYRKK